MVNPRGMMEIAFAILFNDEDVRRNRIVTMNYI